METEVKTKTTVELAVELTCQNCVTKTENALSKVKGIEDFQVNLDQQSVVVTSALPSSKLVDIIETEVGKRAVIMGVGSSSDQQKTLGAAVAMLGGLIGCGSGNIQVMHSRPENLKKLQAKKKLVKSNKSFFFFVILQFWQF